jgi:hypothetical protein
LDGDFWVTVKRDFTDQTEQVKWVREMVSSRSFQAEMSISPIWFLQRATGSRCQPYSWMEKWTYGLSENPNLPACQAFVSGDFQKIRTALFKIHGSTDSYQVWDFDRSEPGANGFSSEQKFSDEELIVVSRPLVAHDSVSVFGGTYVIELTNKITGQTAIQRGVRVD